MSNVVLVAETGSDIPLEVAKKYGIYLVPMHVSFGSETLDDFSFPVEQIYDYYSQTGKIPKTSASSPADFIEVFNKIRKDHPGKRILHLAYSAVTTASYQSAIIASREYEKGLITSIDTKQVSVGQGAIVMEVAKVLEKNPNLSLEEVIETVNALCQQAHMCFLPEDLAYLRAGGRVSNVAYLGSRILNIHPLIEIIDGVLVATKKYRGSVMKLAPRLIREYAQENELEKEKLYLVYSAGLDEMIKKIAEDEAKANGFKEVIWISTGGVITTHSGPSTFGVVGFGKVSK
jgi:EDD domain protein, DegV family